MKIKKDIMLNILGILLLTGLVFVFHRCVPFMMDDIWYGTNLASGESLKNLWDIVEGQIWHYNNWGGRSITHSVLQLTLMSGELCADLLNTIMTLLLAWMICVVANRKSVSAFLMAYALLFSWNANVKMSMFWQAGTVNYVYSTVWILLFMYPFLNEWREKETQKVLGINIWMLPLAVCSGWSNENMGPTCFLLAIATMIYCVKWKKTTIKLWMIMGTIGSFIGSVLVVIAPGNFSRSSTIEETGFLSTIWERFYSMLRAGCDFLFPVCLMLAIVILIKSICLKHKIEKYQIVLLICYILSYGAMVLSPHYPDRATFGTMVLGIVLFIDMISALEEKKHIHSKLLGGLNFVFGLHAIFILLFELVLR